MLIVPPPPTAGTAPARARFRPVPWHDDHPDRLDLDRGLPPDHLARVIDHAVDHLDLADLFARYGGTGSEPYRPDLLLKAVLFEVYRQRHRPAHWYRDAAECAPVRWLLRGYAPARSAWYAFRDRLGPGLLGWAGQAVQQAVAAGLTPARRAAADGTSLAANASRHGLLGEAALAERLRQVEEAVAADAGAAPAADAGAPPPRWLAPTPAGRRRQRDGYRRAAAHRARRQERNRAKRASKRTPAERLRVGVGDPEAPVSRDKEKVFRPLYNAQLVADLDSPLVLGYQVLDRPNDAGGLGPLLEQAQAITGGRLTQLLADSGFAGGPDLAAAQAVGVTVYAPWQANDFSRPQPPRYWPKERFTWQAEEGVYVCPQGQRLELAGSSRQKRSGPEAQVLYQYRCPAALCQACPVRAACTPSRSAGRTLSRSEHEPLLEALRARMGTAEARALYRLRKQTVERLNADLKQHRGLRRLSGRGRARAEVEVGLVVLAHNLVTLVRLRDQQRRVRAGTATPTPEPR
jgi:transposase